mgnify:CR=1 FL=1
MHKVKPVKDLSSTAYSAIIWSIVSNLLLALIKGISGVLGNSYALVADAIESTADVFSSILVYAGLKISHKPADDNHPYGHGKIEPVVTFLVVAFLIFSAGIIAFKSIKNINEPGEVPESWTLYILGAIIIWKEVSFQYVLHKSKITNSSSLKADAWHHRSDAITSILAFIGITIALIFGERYASADEWAALLASGIILYNSYLIFKPALSEIMDEHLHHDLEEKIRKESLKVKGVVDTEKCYIRKSGMQYHVDLHAIVNGEISVRDGHNISHDLKDHLQFVMPELTHILIHIEPDDQDD